jgi:predicted transcriptional regulator
MRTKGALKKEYETLEQDILNELSPAGQSTRQITFKLNQKYPELSQPTVKIYLSSLLTQKKINHLKVNKINLWFK